MSCLTQGERVTSGRCFGNLIPPSLQMASEKEALRAAVVHNQGPFVT